MSHSLFKLLFVTSQIFATLTSRKLHVDGYVAQFPPKGWNSYDSFTWTISEEDFLKNAKLVAELLLPFGYEYVVVDMLWYRKREPGVTFTTAGHDVIDNWGRPLPDPTRWPSSQGGKGFGPVAELVHSMGLKFGIHVVRGISTAAVESNTPIFGAQGSPPGPDLRNWTAADIALLDEKCSFMPDCFVGVNVSSEGGQAFIRSLYQLYADWGVDFVKHDCVFGNDLRLDEIETVSEAIIGTGRPIVYSLAPGNQASPVEAIAVANFTHMYRVTPDVWDSWNDLQLQFDVARDYATAGLIGGPGLDGGRSWPDLDMLPLGWIADPGTRLV